MSSIRNPGRVAALLYLLLVIGGPVRLLYIPNTLFDLNSATATARNIAAHEMLFRMGMVIDIGCAVVLIYLLLALYRVFRNVDPGQAVLMVIVGGVMPSLLYFINVANDEAVMLVVRRAGFLSAFSPPQQDALAMLFIRLHNLINVAAETLWGLWLFPLGTLVFKSGFRTFGSALVPRVIGVWLYVNGVSYLVLSAIGLLAPQYTATVFGYMFPAQLAEVAFMLWLLIRGVREEEIQRVPAAMAAI